MLQLRRMYSLPTQAVLLDPTWHCGARVVVRYIGALPVTTVRYTRVPPAGQPIVLGDIHPSFAPKEGAPKISEPARRKDVKGEYTKLAG